MTEIGRLYGGLYAAVGDMGGLSHFTAMAGTLYRSQETRLMVIGRATNGWKQLDTSSAAAFSREAEAAFGSPGFSWVSGAGGDLRSARDVLYRLSRSPFWRVARRLLAALGEDASGRWVERIAWSNLYKIAPLGGGNPSNALCRAQIGPCRAILAEEIRRFEPTHIFMPVGWNWFESDGRYDFSRLFGGVRRSGGRYAEGSAYFALPDGRAVQAVIACRPERRPEEEYVREIAELFRTSAQRGKGAT